MKVSSVDKQRKTTAELEKIVKTRIGAGDFKGTVHRNPEIGWHATIYGRQQPEVHRIDALHRTPATKAKMAQRIVRTASEGVTDLHALTSAAVDEGRVRAE